MHKRILHKILLANPTHGPAHINKTYLSDGFYCIELNTNDVPKLNLVFPTNPSTKPMYALPLLLPMVWNNSAPSFSTATETIADLAN